MKKSFKRISEKISESFVFLLVWIWYMSKRKQKTIRTTTKKRAKQKSSMEQSTMSNTWPGKYCKVISKPPNWDENCRFVGQTGQCVETDIDYGIKLKFPDGEIVSFPIGCLELMADKINQESKPLVPVKGKSYRVIKKPNTWNSHCKFLSQVGVCVLIDDRGARLRFPNGADLSFQPDCLKESEPIDINSLKSAVEINEDSVVVGNLYRVTKRPDKFGEDAKRLVGMVGKAKWANYRGICLQFSNKSGYVFDFDEVELYIEPIVPNPVNVPKTLNANTIVIGRKYVITSTDKSWTDYEKNNILYKMGEVKFASGIKKDGFPIGGAMLEFPCGIQKFISFSQMEDLRRPTEEELIELIKKYPSRILKIVKGLNKITKLKPVRDFVEKGELPVVLGPEILGPHPEMLERPHTPACFSETINPPTIDETSDAMMNRVASMFTEPQSSAVKEQTDDGYAG